MAHPLHGLSSAMGTALGILLASLVGIIAVVLLVPVRLVASGTFTDDAVDAHALLSWGLGLVHLSVSPSGAELRVGGRRVHRFVAGDRRRERRSRRKARADPVLLWRIVRRSIASLGLHARVSGRVGTGDPADTAQLFALLAAARRFARVDTNGIEIDWVEPAIEVDGQVEGSLWPIAILSIAMSEIVRERRPRAARRGAA